MNPKDIASVLVAVAAIATMACGGNSAASPTPSSTPPPSTTPPPASGPPKPLESATITITAGGFSLDSVSATSYKLEELHVYQGGTLVFVNQDTVPHDVQSDPPHVHTDCPEIGAAGFLVPGQSRATAPLSRLVACGFHDHNHEGDPLFSGKAVVETR